MKQIVCILVLLATVFLVQKNGISQTSLNFEEIKIGNQVWMVKNLDVDHFKNGDAIPEVKTKEEWVKACRDKKPAWCTYENNPDNGEKFGKLYNWYAVNDPRGLAPEGWHVASQEDLQKLTDFLGDFYENGKKLKSTSMWVKNPDYNRDKNGSNASGFTGLPGGQRNDQGVFKGMGEQGFWWISGRNYNTCGGFKLEYDSKRLEKHSSTYNWTAGFSVRCVKN